MSRVVCLLAALLTVAAADPSPEPWTEEDLAALKKRAFAPGAGLLIVEEPVVADFPSDLPQPTMEELLDKSVEEGVAVPESFWDDYFAERPESFLVDPQGLLDDVAAGDSLEFLRYHAADSEVDLFLFLFRSDQTIPAEVRAEELGERLFSEGRPAVVAFYYLGAPEQASMLLSPALSEVVSSVEQRRALASAVEEAIEKADPQAQLEAFALQLSVRIFWMERAAGWASESTAPILPRRSRPTKPAETSHSDALNAVKEWGARHGVITGLGVGAALLVAVTLMVQRRRNRGSFPVFEVAPRMGGAHAAGIGAVISFGSTTRSPSSQKNNLPDYLGL